MLLIMAIAVIPVAGLIEQRLAIAIAQMMAVGSWWAPWSAGWRTPSSLLPAAGGSQTSPASRASPSGWRCAPWPSYCRCGCWPSATRRSHPPAVMKTVALAQQSTSPQCQAGWAGTGALYPGGRPAVICALDGAQPPGLPADAGADAGADDPLAGAASGAPGGQPLPALVLEQRLDHGPHPARARHRGQRHRQDVWLAAAMRCGLYLLVAGYGWLCILLLEQWWPVGRPLAKPSWESDMFTIFLVGIPVILVNMLLQSLVSVWCIRFYVKRFHRREGALAGMLALFGIITLVMLGNLAQIGVWGLFLWLGSSTHPAGGRLPLGVNFATLGYGDIVAERAQWKLLGPLEAVNGAPDDRPLRRLHAGGAATPYPQSSSTTPFIGTVSGS